MTLLFNGVVGGGSVGAIESTGKLNISLNDEHEELLAEMELIERLPTQERLKQAKRRRALQLKKWSDNEKEYQQTISNNKSSAFSSRKKKIFIDAEKEFYNKSIKFQDHVVLLDAIMRKDYDEVERLLQTNVTPNSANEDGLTAIHQCCIDDSADLLRLLISYGADVNVCDNDMWTPLHAAATCANLEICKILIENNAELLAVNTDGNMPYDICDDEVCLEYIESEMAQRGVTQQAIDMKRSETEMRMLDDLKQICQTFNSFTSVTPASLNNNSSINNFTSYFNNSINQDGLIDLNAKDNNGATLLHIACANGYTSILEFLLVDCQIAIESGAGLIPPSIFATDNDGWTPLHVATFWGHQKAIEVLLEHGASIHIKTNNDETVLDLCDDPDIRDFIIQKSKEIETQQQQAAALAAMQKQLQLMNNNSSVNSKNSSMGKRAGVTSAVTAADSSINTIGNNSSNINNTNNNNNSSRSLKRTSTGVSRSSSVRRSSFRDKEKASRKLDTSFKDVLYANENSQLDLKLTENVLLQNERRVSSVNEPLINEKPPRSDQLTNGKTRAPVTTVIANKQTSTGSESSPSVPKLKSNDYNNNQLGAIVNQQIAGANESKSNMARIHSNGNGSSVAYINSSNNIPIITVTNSSANNSSNFSMSSSMASSASLPMGASSVYNTSNHSGQNQQSLLMMTSSLQSATTMSSSSIAVIDVNYSTTNSQNKLSTTPTISTTNSRKPASTMMSINEASVVVGAATLDTDTAEFTSVDLIRHVATTQQPKLTNYNSNFKKPSVDFNGGIGDGVKYKFKSNETIGAKSSLNNEFFDLNSDTNTSKLSTCTKCLKCCFVM